MGIKEPREEVKLLYVNSFQYKDKEKAKWMNYQPAEGHLYRAFFAPINGVDFYRLLMEDKDMEIGNMLLMDLNGNNADWKWNIIEVTESNIIDLPLETKQYEQLAQWRDNMHEDIDKFRRENIEAVTLEDEDIELSLSAAITKAIIAEDDIVSDINEEEGAGIVIGDGIFEALNNLNQIGDKDPDMFDTISGLIKYLASTYGDKYADDSKVFDTKLMMYNDEYGKAVSLFNTMKYIQRYLTTGYKKSENPQDLQKAIHYILFELIRKTR